MIRQLVYKAWVTRCRRAFQQALRLQHDGRRSTDGCVAPAGCLLLREQLLQCLAVMQTLCAWHAALHIKPCERVNCICGVERKGERRRKL